MKNKQHDYKNTLPYMSYVYLHVLIISLIMYLLLLHYLYTHYILQSIALNSQWPIHNFKIFIDFNIVIFIHFMHAHYLISTKSTKRRRRKNDRRRKEHTRYLDMCTGIKILKPRVYICTWCNYVHMYIQYNPNLNICMYVQLDLL